MSTLVTTALRHNTSVSNNIILDSNGRVGIGTAAPGARLDVVESTSIQARFKSPTGGTAQIASYAGGCEFSSNDSSVIYGTAAPSGITTFWAGNAERMRIDASGRVTMPSQPFAHVESAPIAFETTGTTGVLTGGTVLYSTNSFYNSTNGRFTVPVAGNYLVAFFGITQSTDTADTQLLVEVNGTQRGRAYSGGYSGGSLQWRALSFMGVYKLNANDFITFNKSVGTLHTGFFPFRTVYLLG